MKVYQLVRSSVRLSLAGARSSEINMRDIKFRAWDKIGEQWIYFHVPWDFFANSKVPQSFDWWGQFTCLKDKNAKEIYEGDVVRFCFWDGDKTNKPWKISTIIWNEDGVCWDMKTGTVNGIFRNPEYYEVIGNIYENPELLNEARHQSGARDSAAA